MTVKQKQCLLTFLGYNTGGVDGIWGSRSQHALECCQEDLNISASGEWNQETENAILEAVFTYDDGPVEDSEADINVGDKSSPAGTFWDESEFFDREEFRCQCKGKYCDGFPVEPEEELVRVCNEIRRRLGVPVSIVDGGGSGVRCTRHNAAVGGVGNSNHLYGKAADLHSTKSPSEMARIAEEVLAGTGELGVYSWGIHVAVNCKYSRYNG